MLLIMFGFYFTPSQVDPRPVFYVMEPARSRNCSRVFGAFLVKSIMYIQFLHVKTFFFFFKTNVKHISKLEVVLSFLDK